MEHMKNAKQFPLLMSLNMEFIKVGSKVLLAEYKHTSATPPLKLLF
jgi:hypothetical protein